jgi:hypothetical protein
MSNSTFEDLDVGSCQATDIQPFSTDMHLFGVECKQSFWLIAVVLGAGLIKLFQNWIFTKIGQLQRELLQIDVKERNCSCHPKIMTLIFWEFVAGVIGILSILVITGNNFIIWFFIILFNCIGVYIAYSNVEADHHSTAKEFLNMLKTYNGEGCEHENTLKAIELLARILEHHKMNRKNMTFDIRVDDSRDGSTKDTGQDKIQETIPLMSKVPDAPDMRQRKLHL